MEVLQRGTVRCTAHPRREFRRLLVALDQGALDFLFVGGGDAADRSQRKSG
jgi:hypothetical protein